MRPVAKQNRLRSFACCGAFERADDVFTGDDADDVPATQDGEALHAGRDELLHHARERRLTRDRDRFARHGPSQPAEQGYRRTWVSSGLPEKRECYSEVKLGQNAEQPSTVGHGKTIEVVLFEQALSSGKRRLGADRDGPEMS